MEDTKPSVLIVSSSNTKPKSLIKLITKQQNLLENADDVNIISHPWEIDTKYYNANIILHGINKEYKRTDAFNSMVEALIIHMDSNKDTGLLNIDEWSVVEDDCQPDVKILLCNYCSSDTKITKEKATSWCVKRGYELIELYPQNTQTKEDDIIEEKYGIDRIIEVLQAHIWSNLTMKDKDNDKGEENVSLNMSDTLDDFSDLFSQLQMMKESIQSMPIQERKQCAEQMVTAFWKAIGGDDEEIADL